MTNAPFPAQSPLQSFQQYPYSSVRERNTLGIVAFVCALLGLLSGGHLLSPIGLILGLAALGSRPRGFAIWAIVIGLLGTCGWYLVILLAIVAAMGLALAGVGVFFFSQADRIELTTDMGKIAMMAEDYKIDNRGIVPTDMTVLNLQQPTMIDPWGRPYRYVLIEEDPGYDVISEGPDGKAGTDDDVHLSNLEKFWEGAGADFARQLEEFEERSNRPHKTTVKVGPQSRVTVGEGSVTIEAGADGDSTQPHEPQSP